MAQCSISSVLAMEILQFCTKPSICACLYRNLSLDIRTTLLDQVCNYSIYTRYEVLTNDNEIEQNLLVYNHTKAQNANRAYISWKCYIPKIGFEN